jgi:hypothetical protein
MLRLIRFKYLLITFIIFTSITALEFKQVVIWGHKLHSHTHSYIHYGFYKAFTHLGYRTYWFDDRDNVSAFDFTNTLFITEGQVDKKIPLRLDCYYILHHCRDIPRFQKLIDNKRVIFLDQYNDFYIYPHQLAPFTYAHFPDGHIAMPWATDLLPHEIELNKQKIKHIKKTNTIYWIGTIGDGWAGNINELRPFMRACNENRIHFQQKINVSSEQNSTLIQQSYMAPAIVGTWQEKHGYIPCRVFKNISYGQIVATNSQQAHELFENKLIFNKNTHQLFFDTKKRLANIKLEEIYELMDMVKEKHTYINRISTLITFFDDYLEFCKTSSSN